MTAGDYNERLARTMAIILRESRFIREAMSQSSGSAHVFGHAMAESLVREWEERRHKRKPPWIAGRMKTMQPLSQKHWVETHKNGVAK